MLFDFYKISGPENSKNENFASLCRQVLLLKFPKLVSIDGKGGDEGLDAYIGQINGKLHAFQFKYFLDNLGSSQKSQIEKSLQTVAIKHNPVRWTLMTPIDLNPNGIKWFEKIKEKYNNIKIDFIGKSQLQKILMENPIVSRTFQPLPRIIIFDNSTNRFKDDNEIEKDLYDILGLAQDKDGLLEKAIQKTSRFYQNRGSLRVLIWGPGEGDKELYKKRKEIKERISASGHIAHFSEDVWTQEALERTGLNLTVAEYLQAKAYDYIICLMASPGSIAEAHDFAKDKKIAHKMMICIDSNHSAGYSANGMLKIFEGNNGKIDWYKVPNDLLECHLATRIYRQIENVTHARQYESLICRIEE